MLRSAELDKVQYVAKAALAAINVFARYDPGLAESHRSSPRRRSPSPQKVRRGNIRSGPVNNAFFLKTRE